MGRGRKYSLIIVAGIAATSIANNYFALLNNNISGYFISGIILITSLLFATSSLYFILYIKRIKTGKAAEYKSLSSSVELLLSLSLFAISVCRYSYYDVENRGGEKSAPTGNETLKREIKSKIHTLLGHNDEAGVIIAFATGDKNDISPKMRKMFSKSGAMHILALSGLHVGIIFTMLSRILFIMGISHITRELRLVVIILIILLFITLTGYSSSLARAAIMSGIYQIRRLKGEEVDKTGLLLFTAALILIIKPDEISNIGFQLSFAAMAGIVIIYPLMSDYLNIFIENFRWLKLKGTVGVIVKELLIIPLLISIACQITTLPLCFYYFKQIPNYYLLINLAVIPLTSCILYLFVAVISISAIANNATFLCSILQYLVGVLNTIVSYFAT
jgi:ComEC/Rec2-related protein